ncbi:MAG: bifunctional adenosylcobinamide kinase/adenosylcobinamide-phosphate guanylyltransferase [Hyphomicrobiales bacterium]
MITLVLGGARSGKSRYAEQLGHDWLTATPDGERLYIATCQAFDNEMSTRIDKHKEQRGDNWTTIEEPFRLSHCLKTEAQKIRFILVDCLTLWLTNHLLAEHDIEQEIATLCDTLSKADGNIVLVANEVGLGIVPDNKLARQFRDHAGICNQRVAEVADRVVFIAAGLPLVMKG